ncbi:MAG TPA: hypothetical protein IAA52_00115 [Candidatus Pullichristensenella stercorigallinarum]|uniref:SH3b domain-containing protein n=1 Tax=Candidatus Pullichristensenella stercorigallinarum TaxID=2840909 RepID=A0A9D1CVE1_9FIRM|nr:hypothetical protein [Candidatus Pullichristensenella stercorigallinarum]
MHMRGWKRALALFTAMMLALATPALAEYAAYVADSVIPVYADASFSEQVGTISRNSFLTVNAEQNGVAAITYYGKDGYVALSGLTVVNGTPEDATVAANTRFYQQPSTQSAYRLLSAGTPVRLMAVNGTCAMVEVDGYIGFVMRSDLRTAGKDAANGDGSDVVNEIFTATVTARNARVYQSRSTASASRSLTYGNVVTVTAYNDTWARIYNGSSYGYTLRSNLTKGIVDVTGDDSDGEVTYETFAAIVSVPGASVYQYRSTSAPRQSLTLNNVITVVAYDDTWARVYNGSSFGYTLKDNLRRLDEATEEPGVQPTATPAPSESGEVVYETFEATVTAPGARVYQSRSTASASQSMTYGNTVTVVAYDDTWARIYNGSSYGYTLRENLTRVSATEEPGGGDVIYETFEAIVAVPGARVYQSRSLSAASQPMTYGNTVTVVSYDDGWARIYNGSSYGYTPRSNLTPLSTATETPAATATPTPAPTATATPSPTPDNGVTEETFTATVTTQGALVYESPSTASASQSLTYGKVVTVVAYDDTWALIYNGNSYGYTLRTNLTRGTVSVATPTPAVTPTPTPTPAPTSSFDDAVESGDYSNEELTFLYLTQEAGLNTAAACGVLANIKAESSFRPTAYNSSGGSYGICQWTGSRRTRLQNYCEDRGLDYTTLTAQLQFLEYELENYYPKVMNYIRAVDNTADGAYDAGYYFCYHFEAPANRASRSATRGNNARDTYWPKYA